MLINADDLGHCLAFNRGIAYAHRHGIVASASLRANGTAFDHAISHVIPGAPDLEVGVHLNLVEGISTVPRRRPGSPLYGIDGRYALGFGKLAIGSLNKALIQDIEADFRDQIERCLGRLGRAAHINSHQHSHAIPALFRLTCQLAREYGIPLVRLPREVPYLASPVRESLRGWYAKNLVKVAVLTSLGTRNAAIAQALGVRTNDWMVGVSYTGHMTCRSVLEGVDQAPAGARLIEVLVHPTMLVADHKESYCDTRSRDYVLTPERRRETQMLTGRELEATLIGRGWELGHRIQQPLAPPRRRPLVLLPGGPFSLFGDMDGQVVVRELAPLVVDTMGLKLPAVPPGDRHVTVWATRHGDESMVHLHAGLNAVPPTDALTSRVIPTSGRDSWRKVRRLAAVVAWEMCLDIAEVP